MKQKTINLILLFSLFSINIIIAQDSLAKSKTNSGWFSFGGRSTLSAFDSDGFGIGSGGQFRIQFSDRVNSDWFGDYISINIDNKVRSEYYHIGWSVLFYLFEDRTYPKKIQPYVLAGHCFDYNKKTVLLQPGINQDRWGSAVQAGLGTHFNLTNRFDISLTCQYMIHLTKDLDVEYDETSTNIVKSTGSTLEGHLLTTVSFNYKIFRLWKK